MRAHRELTVTASYKSLRQMDHNAFAVHLEEWSVKNNEH